MTSTPQELSKIYHRRFSRTAAYRNKVWQVLTKHFFSRWIGPSDTVLDLGAGYGEFINHIQAGRKFAMDLNPDTPQFLQPDVSFLHQDCSNPWPLPHECLDAVFTSNLFEHLSDKAALSATLRHIRSCLRPGGRLIAIGPNIKYLHGTYWDFYDHHVYLSESSLGEAMEIENFRLEQVVPKFLPFTMEKSPEYPMIFVKVYVAFPFLWWIRGRQFLLVARKPEE